MAKIVTRTRAEAWKLWLNALEFGNYKKVTVHVREGDRFCAWGVACDLAAKDGGRQWHEYEREGDIYKNPNNQEYMPKVIAKFLGMTDEEMWQVINWNDNFSLSLPEIAHRLRTEIMPKALKRP